MVTPDDRRIVEQILRSSLPAESKIWIFGSRARGTEKRSADLDLAIDAGRAMTGDERLSLEIAFEESELAYRVDVVDVYEITGVFRENIERERIPFL